MSIKKFSLYIDMAALLLSLLLLRIPHIFSGSLRQFLIAVTLGILWFVIIKNLLLNLDLRNGRFTIITPDKFVLFLTLLLLILISIGYLRAAENGLLLVRHAWTLIITWLSLLAFSISIFLNSHYRTEVIGLKKCIILALGIYVLFNFILHLLFPQLSVQEAEYSVLLGSQPSILFSLIGINRFRTLFPTIEGFNMMGAVCGAALVVGVLILTSRRFKFFLRSFGLVTIVIALYGLLLSDSRFATMSALLVLIIVKAFPKQMLRRLSIAFILAPLLPLLLLAIANLISRISFILSIARSSTDIYTFNSRAYAWQGVIDWLSYFSEEQLIGYGTYGQLASGVTRFYSQYFAVDNPSLHNFSFQYIFDIGYIGLAVFLLLYIRLLFNLFANNKSELHDIDMIFGALLWFFMISSTLEVALTVYFQEIFALFLLITAASMRRGEIKVKNRNQSISVPRTNSGDCSLPCSNLKY